MKACQLNFIEKILQYINDEQFCSKLNINTIDEKGNTPLHYAALYGSSDLI